MRFAEHCYVSRFCYLIQKLYGLHFDQFYERTSKWNGKPDFNLLLRVDFGLCESDFILTLQHHKGPNVPPSKEVNEL